MTDWISILVRLFGVLSDRLPADASRGKMEMTVLAGTDVATVLARLGIDEHDGAQLVVMVNGRQVKGTHILQGGDVLSAFPALAGG